MDQSFMRLQKYFIASLPQRKKSLELFYIQFASESDLASLENIYREIQILAKTASTYKLINLATAACQTELFLSTAMQTSNAAINEPMWKALLYQELQKNYDQLDTYICVQI